MSERHISYLIRKGTNEYLKALVGQEGETDTSKMWPTFTIYKHDAAKIPKLTAAQQIIRMLRKDDEIWNVSRYNTITHYEEKITCEDRMKVDEKMRLNRAMKYLEDEKRYEETGLKAIEDIHLKEIIIIRNKKQMYLAEVNQMIRNVKVRLDEIEAEEEGKTA